MANKRINYTARDFRSARSELIEFAKIHYPDIFRDFNDASIGMLLLEFNAAISDMLSNNIDRVVQEVNLDFAQQRTSVFALARTYGLKIPFKKPAVTLVDFSFDLPVRGDTFDLRYAPIILRGAQVIGGGQTFETVNNIDFSSPFNESGLPNRTIIPNFDGSGKIVSYTVTKREIVLNGRTKLYKRIIGQSDSRPFLEVDLPDADVLSVESIITLDGTNYSSTPTLEQQTNPDNIWYEVDSLAENKVFIENVLESSDQRGVVVGQWVEQSRRFTLDYTDNGYATITFGGGFSDVSEFEDYIPESKAFLDQIGRIANNYSLGEIPRPNTTAFIKYRVGGGIKGNVGVNILNNIGQASIFVNGINRTLNERVKSSLTVNNPIPAVGGAEAPSVEEIRQLVKYNFSSQNRCDTASDYYAQIAKMDGKFGVPYRYSVSKEFNKVVITISTLDADNKISNQSNSVLKRNIEEYLSKYKSINDYISVKDSKILNLSFEFEVFVNQNINRNEIASNIVNTVSNYMSKDNISMGEDILISKINSLVTAVGGVRNLIQTKVYNLVGGNYSLNETGQPLLDENTRQINLGSTNTIFANGDEIFEVKYPETDIKIRFSSF